jgi:hypothetical protein
MRAENLTEVIRAAPFRPFVLCLADGDRVEVRHPDFIAYAGGRTAVVIDPDDRSHTIDVMLVTKIEQAPAAAAGARGPTDGE